LAIEKSDGLLKSLYVVTIILNIGILCYVDLEYVTAIAGANIITGGFDQDPVFYWFMIIFGFTHLILSFGNMVYRAIAYSWMTINDKT